MKKRCGVSTKMWLTLNIYEQRWWDSRSMLILRLAVVEATLLGIDWGEVVDPILSFSQHGALLVPLVIGLGVSSATAAQGHSTAFHVWTRGKYWHRGNPRSIWWRTEDMFPLTDCSCLPLSVHFNMWPHLGTKPTTQCESHWANPRPHNKSRRKCQNCNI